MEETFGVYSGPLLLQRFAQVIKVKQLISTLRCLFDGGRLHVRLEVWK